MAGWIILAGIVLFVFWVILAYNRLVTLRNQVQNAWRQIGVHLKRRHDLIPNLVSTVKGAMEFERETLEKVIEVRAKALSAATVSEKGVAENLLSKAFKAGGTLPILFLICHAYLSKDRFSGIGI